MPLTTSRRLFLASLTGSALGAVLPACRTSRPRSDSALERDLVIIDTHTHFYDPSRPQGVPWPPADDPVLYRTVLPKQYLELPKPAPVTGAVVVEASPWVEDNQWVLDLAERDPFIVGFVGNLPVGTPEFAGHLERFAAQPLFRGIRARDVNLAQAVENPAFLADLQLVASRGLSLDLVGGPDLLQPANRLARQVPDLPLVIDHLAGLRIDGAAPDPAWLDQMRQLARCPKVCCKVSGLVEGTGRRGGHAPADLEFYRPVLDTVWKLFGADRLVYGSNWPVCEHFAPLGAVQGIVSRYFREQGTEAQEKVFWRNARAVYRWVPRKTG